MRISMIVAVATNGVIGKGGKMPWHLPRDLQHFKRATTGHAVIMGRKTYESIGKPLPKRLNIVLSRCAGGLSRGSDDSDDVVLAASPDAALAVAREAGKQEAFIIGGAEIYHLFEPMASRILMTNIHVASEGDVYFALNQPSEWYETARTHHPPDAQNNTALDFITMERRGDKNG